MDHNQSAVCHFYQVMCAHILKAIWAILLQLHVTFISFTVKTM